MTDLRAQGQQPCIVIVGSLITDLVAQVDKAPAEGETVIGTNFGRFAGGKGANQAVAAARLGAKTVLIGRVGDDLFADEQLTGLQQAGVDTSFITKDTTAPSGVAAIILDAAGRNRIAIVPGANNNTCVADLEKAKAVIESAHFLLVQLELPLEITKAAIAVAQEVNTPVILNPAPARPLAPEILNCVTVITPNEVEAAQLTQLPVHDVSEVAAAARSLLAKGPKAAVITLGERGVFVAQYGVGGQVQETYIPPHRVTAVDTVAAGDAFNGALAVRLAAGDDLVAAARYANAVAAISVTKRGAQAAMPLSSEVAQFLQADVG